MAIRPRALLIGAALCAGAFLVLLALAYGSPGARWIDASSLQGFLGLQGGRVSPLTERVGSLGDAFPVAVMAALLAVVAFARGMPRVSLLVLAYVGLTSISSQVLKSLLAYPRTNSLLEDTQITPAAFPSGHATATMTLAVALVVVVAPRLRVPAAIVGGALALGVSFSVVSMGWHFPSDVIGGFLLATGWGLVLLAGLQAAAARYPPRAGRSVLAQRSRAIVDAVSGAGLVATVLVGAVLAVAMTVALVAFRLPDLVDYAQEHTAFFAVAMLLGVSAVGLLGAVATALTRRG